jgi:hypothetical protein
MLDGVSERFGGQLATFARFFRRRVVPAHFRRRRKSRTTSRALLAI